MKYLLFVRLAVSLRIILYCRLDCEIEFLSFSDAKQLKVVLVFPKDQPCQFPKSWVSSLRKVLTNKLSQIEFEPADFANNLEDCQFFSILKIFIFSAK